MLYIFLLILLLHFLFLLSLLMMCCFYYYYYYYILLLFSTTPRTHNSFLLRFIKLLPALENFHLCCINKYKYRTCEYSIKCGMSRTGEADNFDNGEKSDEGFVAVLQQERHKKICTKVRHCFV